MAFVPSKRSCSDTSKKSPLKAVSPIIRKYDGHRQKRKKIILNAELCELSCTTQRKNLKALLPKTDNFEEVTLEPELISAVNPASTSIIQTTSFPDDLLSPVKEICEIARLAAEEQKARARKLPTIRHPRKRSESSASAKKQLMKKGKLMETSLEVLRPEPASVISAREEAYAANYFQKVKCTLGEANQHLFDQFCILLSELENEAKPVPKFYEQLKNMFSPWPILIEDFIPFLTPEQAVDCNVFMEHLTLTKLGDFLCLIETHFAKTPYQVKKIHAALEKLSNQPNVGLQDVTVAIIPLLKGNAVLTDYFLELLPQGRPPANLMTDFEELDEDALSEGSDDGEEQFERIEVPPVKDPYGGDACICSCHNSENEKLRTRLQHCIPCSTKFINGKIFIQCGRLLRRATVVFKDHDMTYHRNRLMNTNAAPRRRKRSSSGGKDCLSPSKSAGLSSDELKSDADDEEKTRGRGVKGVRTPRSRKLAFDVSQLVAKDETALVDIIKTEPDHLIDIENSKVFADDIKQFEVSNGSSLQLGNTIPSSSTVVYLTPTEAEELLGVQQNLISNQDSDVILTVEVESQLEKDLARHLQENESVMRDVSKSIKVDVDIVDELISPPVLSIPENVSIQSEVDPLLSVVEDSVVTVKLEPSMEAPQPSLGDDEASSASRLSDMNLDETPWKIEEDRVILHTLQVESYCEETFDKIREALPPRTTADIKKRFQELLNILSKMKAENS